jgi:hypothetical protein
LPPPGQATTDSTSTLVGLVLDLGGEALERGPEFAELFVAEHAIA